MGPNNGPLPDDDRADEGLCIPLQSVLAQYNICIGSNVCEPPVLRPLERQDSEDLDRLIVATDTGLLQLTCLLFNSEWFWDDLMDSWTDYLMSPFEDYPLDDAQ